MRSLIFRHAAAAALVLFCAAPLCAQTNPFYTSLLQRGLADAKLGNWKAAAQELRLAAFGLLDDLPKYQTAHLVGAVAAERSGQFDEARIATEKVVIAERLSHAYTSLAVEPAMRASFESLVAKYMTADRIAAVPAFAHIRAGTTPPTPPPPPAATAAPVPAKPPLPPLAEGHDIALRARSFWIAGDLANAVKLATEAITRDFASGPARQVLGNIAAIERRWNDVVEHFTIARTTQRLTEDEKGKLATGFANVGRNADADALRRTMAAVATIPPSPPAPRTVAPQPQPRALVVQPPPPPPAQAASTPKPAPPVRPSNAPRTPPATTSNDGLASGTWSKSQPAMRLASPAPNAERSPLVAAARHTPSDAVLTSDSVLMLNDADRLLAEGKIIAARDLFARVAHLQTLNRATLLSAAKGLNQTSAWRDSSASYQRAYPFTAGEEIHMFHEAVNRYELGDYANARDLLKRALPRLTASREVSLYKSKIEAAR